MNKVIHGDCLIESEQIVSGSVDLILTDLPYGTINRLGGDLEKYKRLSGSDWDVVIDTNKIMQIANRILRKNGKMVLFANQPYTTELISNQIPNLPHSYNMYWDKMHFANCLVANKAPVSYMEDILVFSKPEDIGRNHALINYFIDELRKTGMNQSQMNSFLGNKMGGHYFTNGTQFRFPSERDYHKLQETGFFQQPYSKMKIANQKYTSTFNLWEGKKYKSNILKYAKDYDGYHPTQKPVLLLEDLIKTFSNEGDLVVDLTAGSGSTAVACRNTDRRFIVIEKEKEYIDIINNRIKEHETQLSII